MSSQIKEDFQLKIEKVRELIRRYNVCGILIDRQLNFSWLCGGRGFISLASEKSCAAFIVTSVDVHILAENIEGERILKEELEEISSEVSLDTFYWFDNLAKQRIIDKILGESSYLTDSDLSDEFYDMRSRLTSLEIERYRWLGKKSANIVEQLCMEIKQGVSEYETAGILSKKFYECGIEPVTILIAFDSRISQYRHPLPTFNKLENYAMVSVCARKWGIYVSLTRFVSITSIDHEIKNKSRAVAAVDAAMIESTRPGIAVKDIFCEVVEKYAKLGYPGEWKLHHQGGLTGYAAREFRAFKDSCETVFANQVYAWNPSITGTKSEDTILVLDSGNVILTYTGDYEYIDVECRGRIVKRPGILKSKI